jgi:hypothetical protein
VGTTSPAVCGFPRELLWRGWCWFLVQLLIKNFIAPVTLLFRHTLYSRNVTYLCYEGICYLYVWVVCFVLFLYLLVLKYSLWFWCFLRNHLVHIGEDM